MTQTKGEVMHLAELKQKSIADLNEVARDLKIDGAPNLRKQELIFAILQAQTANNGVVFGEHYFNFHKLEFSNVIGSIPRECASAPACDMGCFLARAVITDTAPNGMSPRSSEAADRGSQIAGNSWHPFLLVCVLLPGRFSLVCCVSIAAETANQAPPGRAPLIRGVFANSR